LDSPGHVLSNHRATIIQESAGDDARRSARIARASDPVLSFGQRLPTVFSFDDAPLALDDDDISATGPGDGVDRKLIAIELALSRSACHARSFAARAGVQVDKSVVRLVGQFLDGIGEILSEISGISRGDAGAQNKQYAFFH